MGRHACRLGRGACRQLEAIFEGIAGRDGVIDRGEFLSAIGTALDLQSIPADLHERLFHLCERLDVGAMEAPPPGWQAVAAGLGLRAGPSSEEGGRSARHCGPAEAWQDGPERSEAGARAGRFSRRRSSKVVPTRSSSSAHAGAARWEQFHAMAETLAGGDILEWAVWLFALCDSDESGALDGEEAARVWLAVVRRWGGDADISDAAAARLWEAVLRPRLWDLLHGEAGKGSLAGGGDGDSDAPRLLEVARRYRELQGGRTGQQPEVERRGADITLEQFLRACRVAVCMAQVGLAIGTNSGVLDPATGRVLPSSGDAYDPSAPEMLRFAPSEYDALSDAFAKRADGRGLISGDAFCQLFEGTLPRPELRSALLRTVDADGSGDVSFVEFVAAMDALSNGSVEERARVLFALYDADGSGDLSVGEVRTMVRDMLKNDPRLGAAAAGEKEGEGEVGLSGEALTFAAVAALCDLADEDGSGTLSVEEVVRHAGTLVTTSSCVIDALPPDAAFGARDREHPMAQNPLLAVLLAFMAVLPALMFNIIYDGPGAQGPLLRDEFGWTIAEIGFFSTVYQIGGIVGNLFGGIAIDRFGAAWMNCCIAALICVATVLQTIATSGGGSYALYVASRTVLGLSECVFSVSAVLLVAFVSPEWLSIAIALKANIQAGTFTVSRLAIVPSLSLRDYHFFLCALAVLDLGAVVIVALFAPRRFPIWRRAGAPADAAGRPLVASLVSLTRVDPPKIKAKALKRLPGVFWVNLWLACGYYGLLFTYQAFAPFWYTASYGDSLNVANTKTNILIMVVIGTTLAIGVATNHFGYRAHALTAGFAPIPVACFLAAAIEGFDSWVYAVVFSLGWGSIIAHCMGLVPLYVKDKGLHGTAYGVLFSLSSIGAALVLTGVAALAPPNDATVSMSVTYFREANLLLGAFAFTMVPAGLAMVFLDRKPRNLAAGKAERLGEDGGGGQSKALNVFTM